LANLGTFLVSKLLIVPYNNNLVLLALLITGGWPVA
jgi:hypothetical protein